VVFACAAPNLLGTGAYADPRSPWFNAFFGYYEIQVAMDDADAAFGYQDPLGQPDIEAIARVGLADWNLFSNELYGVPSEVSAAACRVPIDRESGSVRRVRRGARAWDRVELPAVQACTPATARVARPVHLLWQAAFGRRPAGAPVGPAHIPMRAVFYSAWGEGECLRTGRPIWRTWVFGGTVRADIDTADTRRLLQAQLDSIHAILDQRQDLGLRVESGRGSPDPAA